MKIPIRRCHRKNPSSKEVRFGVATGEKEVWHLPSAWDPLGIYDKPDRNIMDSMDCLVVFIYGFHGLDLN
jgi:hypothetical protein